jgi:K+ potassium transporter
MLSKRYRSCLGGQAGYSPITRPSARRGRDLVGARGGAAVILLGIISGALFYGDAIITPALSVLSAVEGLKVATPAFEHYVVPLTVVMLIALFAVRSRGTARVAAFFGPFTCFHRTETCSDRDFGIQLPCPATQFVLVICGLIATLLGVD